MLIKNYASRIRQLLPNFPDLKVEELSNQDTMSSFIEAYSGSTSARNGLISALKVFLRFLGKTDIKLPKHIKIAVKTPDYITEKYFETTVIPIAEKLFKKDETKLFKVKSILMLMMYSGLHLHEIAFLRRENVDLKRMSLKIIKPRERIVYMKQGTAKFLRQYFAREPEKDYAFNITYRSLQNLFAKISHEITDIQFNSILLRHSFAVNYLKDGGNIEELYHLLGNTSIERYRQFDTHS